MLPELTADEYSAALDAVASEVLGRLPDDEPPIDALRLAQALGIAVAWDESQSGRGRVARLARAGESSLTSILVRPELRRERLEWAIAHEIGELAAKQVFRRLSVDPREAPHRLAVVNRVFGLWVREIELELPRFRGHRIPFEGVGVHDAEESCSVSAGVPAKTGGAGAVGTKPGRAGQAVRALSAGHPQLGSAG